MSTDPRLKVVLCWHMHQPVYRDAITGQYQLPWTYLHVIKDYTDMAAHLEKNPGARAVVNFAPVLLEQIDDYATQIRAALNGGDIVSDPLLAALVGSELPADPGVRYKLLQSCLRVNEQRLINRFPAYRRLADMVAAGGDDETLGSYVSDQFLTDILVWYHIAWLGETIRRSDLRIKALIDKGSGFTAPDRQVLAENIKVALETIIERYRALAETGQIELAVSPYAHPIVPLMLDFSAARESIPDSDLPAASDYPGGEERAAWHIEHAKTVFEHYFGFQPVGCWPSEGGVSDGTLRLLGDAGFRWAASGGNVLSNSRAAAGLPIGDGHINDWRYSPATVPDCEVQCFFRDDGLSDLIGFTYATWHADDAVADLINHLENICANLESPGEKVVAIILDGENAWEHYPENGYYLLDTLYAQLGSHPDLQLTTFSDCIDDEVTPQALPGLVAGSWVYGTFSTWMGHADKNLGWDLLVEARKAYIATIDSTELDDDQRHKAMLQLAVCEGSDWYWWFGDYNPSDTVHDFDRLFRNHLKALYQLLGLSPPDNLSQPISAGGGSIALGGVMLPGQAS